MAANNDSIEADGTVIDTLWNGKYKIHLPAYDMIVEWYVSWKMKKNNIRIIPWDGVKVELNPYEPTKWRITYRSIKNPWS
jgi:translation initiation factor IF-1